mmetsp:Transcript_15044/g.34881  ORF Transcript_15044/g.34881 Transcript_15044/m.34881 type:complete len:248 (-) Transcript_15044:145-888(-)
MSSPAMSKALAIAPKFPSFLSICGSSSILTHVLRDPARRKKTKYRLLVGVSICDILVSTAWFVGTWAIPSGTLSIFGHNETTTETVFLAAGDQRGITCSINGFFNQFVVAVLLYNVSFSVYCLLVIKFEWRDDRVAKIEWLFHAIPLGYGLATSIFALAFDLYGPVEWQCWITQNRLDENPIQKQYIIMQWVLGFGVAWICPLFHITIFAIIYCKMLSLEQRMRRYATDPTRAEFARSNKIALQGAL